MSTVVSRYRRLALAGLALTLVGLLSSCMAQLTRPEALARDFTIIVLPDTQFYTANSRGGTSSTFVAQVDWVVSNRTARNVAYVTRLGDITENGGIVSEWQNARDALYRLEDPAKTGLPHGIPYGVALGNHDLPRGGVRYYNESFGPDHFRGRPYYGGNHGRGGENHFNLFSASGMDFVVLTLSCAGLNSNVMHWANQVLKSHADRHAIVVTHSLISTGNPAPWTAAGQPIFDALKGNTNLFLMLCGHVPGAGWRRERVDGRTIDLLLSDYQGMPRGGDGYLRIMTFSPTGGVVQVETYSPTLNQSLTDALNRFSFDCPAISAPLVQRVSKE